MFLQRFILSSGDDAVFSYATHSVDYDVVKRGILENTSKLRNHGFSHEWNKALGLEEFEMYRNLEELGYRFLEDEGVLCTSFHRRDMPFHVKIDTDYGKALIEGVYPADYSEKRNVTEVLEVLEKISGISFELVIE